MKPKVDWKARAENYQREAINWKQSFDTWYSRYREHKCPKEVLPKWVMPMWGCLVICSITMTIGAFHEIYKLQTPILQPYKVEINKGVPLEKWDDCLDSYRKDQILIKSLRRKVNAR